MAKIPDFTALGGTPTPQPSAAVASYRPVDGAEAIGTALTGAGHELQQAGEYEFRVQRQAKEKNDTLRAEDALNQYRERQLDLTMGEGKGFVHVKGGDAVKRPLFNDYMGQLKEAANQISGGLDNDEQRAKFRQHAPVATLQFQQDLIRHVDSERNAYSKQVFEGTLATELRQASSAWKDEPAILAALTRMNAAIGTEARRVGAAPEALEATLQENAGKVHAAVIGQALAAGDYAYAETWFKQHRDTIDTPTAKLMEKALYDGHQKQVFNGFTREFIDGGRNLDTLMGLEKRIAEDPTLDETRKNALLGRVEARRESLIRQAQHGADRTEKMLERQINAVNTMTLQGFEPTTEQIAPLVNAASGTALEPQVRQMVAVANETRRFRGMPFIAQEAYLTQLESAVRSDPTKFDVGMVSRFKAIHESQKKQANENPVGFSVRQGFVPADNPGAQPLNLSKPDEIGGTLPGRFELARQVSRNYNVPFKPLQPEEVAVLRDVTRQMQPAQKSAYFGALAASAGTDRDGYRAMMQQISPDDPVTAAAGIAAQRGLTTDKGRALADIIFRGQAYLNPPKKEDGQPVKSFITMPADKDLEKRFNDVVGNAFDGRPTARNIFLQTARAIYAEKMVSGNNYKGEGDQSGVLNTTVWDASVKMALGGEPVERAGRTAIPPPGMDASAFRDAVSERVRALETAGRLPDGMTARTLRNLPLMNYGDTSYVLMSGDAKMKDRDGRDIVIDLERAPVVPERRSQSTPVESERRGGPLRKDAVVPNRSAVQVHQSNIADIERELGRVTDQRAKAILTAELAAERRLLQRSSSVLGAP